MILQEVVSQCKDSNSVSKGKTKVDDSATQDSSHASGFDLTPSKRSIEMLDDEDEPSISKQESSTKVMKK